VVAACDETFTACLGDPPPLDECHVQYEECAAGAQTMEEFVVCYEELEACTGQAPNPCDQQFQECLEGAQDVEDIVACEDQHAMCS